MRSLPLSALMLLLALPASAAEPSDNPLEKLPATASAEVLFTPGIALLTPGSRERLAPVVAKGRAPGCFWLARGRSKDEAELLKAALAENDIAVETIAVEIKTFATFAEARLYCTPPERVTAYFVPGRSELTDDARRLLSIVTASYWSSETSLVVRGYAEAAEAVDPLQLGLDRAQAARSYLIQQGLSAKRLAMEANTQHAGREALRVEVMPTALKAGSAQEKLGLRVGHD